MSPSPPDEVDTPRIGPYRALHELGRGGQAIVWLAEDTRIGRRVALKVLPPLGPGGEEVLLRFRREAEVAARLEHPAICAILEADLDGRTPYIAMRYVQGETLAKRIAKAREAHDSPPERAALRALGELCEKIARALHAAHEAGIVHRDVKPANLMITPEGDPVVLDFGLAREDEGATQTHSITGEVSGTPAYMSPEQMTGRARPDRRTDVWALGVVLHEAATLTHSFEAVTREGLFQAILAGDPPDPRRVNPAIDRDLATILETATGKDRDRRYQSAGDMADDLRRWLADEPIRARPVGRVERLARWMRRKPALAATSAAALVLLLAASALLAYGIGASGRADVEAGLRAAAESERARADAARATLEQVDADKRLSDALDELNMQMGTLWFGLGAKGAVSSLAPKYLAALRDDGIDLEQATDEASLVAELDALRIRDGELWSVVLDAMRNLVWIVTLDEEGPHDPSRGRVLSMLEALPRMTWPELEAAQRHWRAEGVDTFGPLLEEEALAGRGAEQLHELAEAIIVVPGRLSDAERVIDRALASDPGSFRLHYLAAALGFLGMSSAPTDDSEAARQRAAKLLHHSQITVALRPRSGFVRALLASALAMNARIEEAVACMDEATALEPDNALVWLFKARFYSFSPLPQPGIDACKKALELDPDLAGVRELMAELEAKKR